MIDWSEGQLRLRKLVDELYDALLLRDVDTATEICHEIVVEARMVRAKINESDSV